MINLLMLLSDICQAFGIVNSTLDHVGNYIDYVCLAYYIYHKFFVTKELVDTDEYVMD